jgi:hypothetical protein
VYPLPDNFIQTISRYLKEAREEGAHAKLQGWNQHITECASKAAAEYHPNKPQLRETLARIICEAFGLVEEDQFDKEWNALGNVQDLKAKVREWWELARRQK